MVEASLAPTQRLARVHAVDLEGKRATLLA